MNEKDTNQENTTENKHNIIYFTNRRKLDEEENSANNPSLKKTEPTKYIATATIAILIYSICVWVTNASFSEIIDLELPLLIILTLILTELKIQGYGKIAYLIYIIASILCYTFIQASYALFPTISFTAVIIYSYLEKIYYNKNDYPNLDNDEFKLSAILSRVKYHILLSLVIFVIFLLLGYYYPGVFQPLVMPSVENLQNGVQEGTVRLETISLFVNNFSVAANMIISGFYLSTTTVYLLIFNALFIGFSGAITDIKYFLAFTVPHGIIELTAIILASAAGFRLTHAILVLLNGIKINKEDKKEIFLTACSNFLKMFADVIILIIIITVMLLIAAFIEANLTISIGTYLYNL